MKALSKFAKLKLKLFIYLGSRYIYVNILGAFSPTLLDSSGYNTFVKSGEPLR